MEKTLFHGTISQISYLIRIPCLMKFPLPALYNINVSLETTINATASWGICSWQTIYFRVNHRPFIYVFFFLQVCTAPTTSVPAPPMDDKPCLIGIGIPPKALAMMPYFFARCKVVFDLRLRLLPVSCTNRLIADENLRKQRAISAGTFSCNNSQNKTRSPSWLGSADIIFLGRSRSHARAHFEEQCFWGACGFVMPKCVAYICFTCDPGNQKPRNPASVISLNPLLVAAVAKWVKTRHQSSNAPRSNLHSFGGSPIPPFCRILAQCNGPPELGIRCRSFDRSYIGNRYAILYAPEDIITEILACWRPKDEHAQTWLRCNEMFCKRNSIVCSSQYRHVFSWSIPFCRRIESP